ncbi:Potassium channel domain-containing protein [Caenorhabditis elegans]|uniref:Potassium channel domain-containing protein n=1 Tax=Caenorhabditis elegans TaxID=6239 RepID=Q9XX01_CAEEL|nr:Potassium channel domain-containing protein [Caenorhabditis elegans]CAA21041.2 Potassium channel domain-containing protein [Caenorhabditis elegans]|eukprot:NP_001022883.1 TWiK family of potassium channels [Caenorhabditis elegans]
MPNPSPTPLQASPTTTLLADGYTDDALPSKYDNFRASRPYSRESLLSNTSLGSKVRFSQFSFQSRDDLTTIDDEEEEEYRKPAPPEPTKFLQVSRTTVRMLAGGFSRAGSLEGVETGGIVGPPMSPISFLGKCKHYYDKYKLDRISASVLLVLYSFLGAWVFYLFEHDYEREVKLKERIDLRMLRNDTFQRISSMVFRQQGLANFEEVFIDYEKKLHVVRLPECLDWDYWGALFYVGTLFTTIGYGNIYPRTALGRAASVVYAIVGIPLVLAILSKCGKWMTDSLSEKWQQHRIQITEKAKMTKNRLRGKKILKSGEIVEANTGAEADPEKKPEVESRTIPIWLALLICVVYVAGCSSLFLLWETRWTFFTSLYFFCISLLTIGLGDIVPDKPHMFIVMFVLVIVGLSIVSMFISVVQIKIEEWLCRMIEQIKEEYMKKDGLVDPEEIKRIFANDPVLSFVAPKIMSGEQNHMLKDTIKKFDRLLESKEIQTDFPVKGMATQVEKYEQSMACDPMSNHLKPAEHQGTQWSRVVDETGEGPRNVEELKLQRDDATSISRSNDFRDSISDATSLPMDSMSSPVAKKRNKRNTECAVCQCDLPMGNTAEFKADGTAQTDLAQFQIDEIAIKLANLQTQRVRPPIVEMATSAFMEDSPLNSEALDLPRGLSQADINVICEAMSSSFFKNSQEALKQIADIGVGKDYETTFSDKSQLTSLSLPTVPTRNSIATSPVVSLCEDLKASKKSKKSRSISSSPIPPNSLHEEETQTPLRQNMVHMATDPCTSQLVHRSTVTSPVGREDAETEMPQKMMDRMVSPVSTAIRDQNTSPVEEQTPDFDDRSIQTSISEWFGKLLKKKDESQQTSICDDVVGKSKKEGKKKKASRDENSQASSLGSDVFTSSNPSSTSDDSEKNHKKIKKTLIAPNMTASVSMSTQYSPPPGFDRLSEPHSTRARSSSTSGMGTSIFEDETRQEVIVQTDDSYLKIARRLDEYRNNKTQFLPVCAAAPLSSKEVEPFKSDRPSERSHYYFGGGRRASLGRGRKKPRQDMRYGESQTGQSMDAELLKEVLNEEESPPKELRKKSVNFAETTM